MSELPQKKPYNKTRNTMSTPSWLAWPLVELGRVKQGDSVLEPSAGSGHLAKIIAKRTDKKNISCVEVSSLQVKIIRQRGFHCEHLNFLAKEPTKKFDKIVMHPPSTGGQAKAHVKHALKFLADGGRLVAIVPKGFKTDGMTDGRWTFTLSDSIKQLYPETSIPARILRAKKGENL